MKNGDSDTGADASAAEQPAAGPRTPLVFDGHNDALSRLWRDGLDGAEARFRDGDSGQLNAKAAREGGFAGGMFALFVPPGGSFDLTAFDGTAYDIPLPPEMATGPALATVIGQISIMLRLERAGLVAICRSADDIDSAFGTDRIAAVLQLEGAEAIGADLAALDALHALGLRSLGPVWSRPTIFGHGVPFRFPADPDIGPGLTAAGRALVERCAALGIVVDASHLNLRGFWDVAELGVPLVATHSNAHALTASSRNLTDDQLREIGASGGMVGLNFGRFFLRPDGGIAPDGTLEMCIDHLDHLLAHAGEDHVGLGSDFDGAPMPPELTTAAGLSALRAAMLRRGYREALIENICNRNWRAFLRRAWGA